MVDNEDLPIDVEIQNTEACKRYACVSITGCDVKESPKWLQDKLNIIGLSSDDKSSKSESDWDSSNDITIVSREDGSGTRGAFIELFGIEEKKDGEKVDMTTDDAQITNSTSVMLTTVAGDDYAIGYVSLGSLNDTVKALKIDGEEATEQNIKDGKYKICRPFNIATKKAARSCATVPSRSTKRYLRRHVPEPFPHRHRRPTA